MLLWMQQALDPNYSFSDVAKPYALELLNLQVHPVIGRPSS